VWIISAFGQHAAADRKRRAKTGYPVNAFFQLGVKKWLPLFTECPKTGYPIAKNRLPLPVPITGYPIGKNTPPMHRWNASHHTTNK